MKLRIVRTIYFKELLETFRDRRTMIAMIGVPIFLYPGLFLVASQVSIVQQQKVSASISRVAVHGQDAEILGTWVEAIEQVEVVEHAEPLVALDAGDLDAVVSAPEGLQAALDGVATAEVLVEFDATESNSREAIRRLAEGLRDRRSELLDARLEARGLDESFARPLDIGTKNIASPSKSTGSILGMILPLIMVVMLGVGAFYPAIDLTAGEKERGTFETLLSTPTSKLEIISGKFLAVFTLSMFTGLLNLASMIATLVFQISQIFSMADDSGIRPDLLEVPPQAIISIILVLIPLAFFISAVMMTVALLARSFKEAQNYVSPFFLLIVMPASLAAVPGMELTRATQFIPIGNVALLFRDLMTGKASYDMVFIVFLCTAVYAALALVAAAWMFRREEVILADESGLPVTLHRGLYKRSSDPPAGLAFGIFAIVMLLIFYIGSYAQLKNLYVGLIVTQYLLILAPIVFFLWYTKVDFRSALNLRLPPVGALVGTLIAAPAWVVLSIQLSVWLNRLFPAPVEFAELTEQLFAMGDTTWGVIGLLLIVAVSPAICEEMLFRGVLVSGLRQRVSPWAVILIVGLLFGLFHLSIYKIVPTGLSGVFFTYLAVRSGSILLPMIAHFTLNGLSILLETERLPESLVEFMVRSDIEVMGLPTTVVAVAGGIFAAGIVIVERSRPRS